MAKKRAAKTPMETFIKTVMKHAGGSLADIAKDLKCSRQAVSKRLREYRDRGVRGLPDFDGRTVEVGAVQDLINKYKGK
jgi:biotin operon repressor